jgi:AcrR family transcriptional regulator
MQDPTKENSKTSENGSRARGRPRSERSHQAIIDATNELLVERGFADLTMDEVAERAGVSKATIYRRWPSKGTLVFEAFSVDFLARQARTDSGSLKKDLTARLRSWVRVVNGTVTGRTLASLLAEAQRDDELAVIWRDRFIRPVREESTAIVKRAVARGELSQRTDPDVLLDLLYGPLYHRLLQKHLPLSERFADMVVSTVLSGIQPGARISDN